MPWKTLLLTCAALILGFSQSATIAADRDILFYANFDQGLKAQIARGNPAPITAPAQPQFVEGKFSQGLLTGDPDSTLEYETLGNMDLEAGTVAMWVKPVDWSVDTHMRFFFTVSQDPAAGPDTFLWLYKFFRNSVFWLTQQNEMHREILKLTPASADTGGAFAFDWQAGRWDHLIGSWSGNLITMYVNGRYVGTINVNSRNVLKVLKKTFAIGGPNRRNGGKADTVLDEVLILRHPVNPDEAKIIVEKGIDGVRSADFSASKPLLEVSASGYVYAGEQVTVTTTMVGRRRDQVTDGMKFRVELFQPDKTQPVLARELPVGDLRQKHTFDGASLPIGEYRMQVSLLDKDQTLASASTSFDKKQRPAFLDNKRGITDRVPRPWTPLEHKGDTVSCWGRAYRIGGGGLMSQVMSQGQELLAAPVTLQGKINGKACEVSALQFTWNEQTARRGSFTARGQLGTLPITVTGSVEFDGFVWYEIGIAADPQTTISDLMLVIPMREQVATLVQGKKPGLNAGDGGTVRPLRGKISAAPVFWLGNEDVGLQWCTADTRYWRLNDLERMVALEPGEKAVNWRITLVDHPVKFDRPAKYTLGLHATPVKPLPDDWRSWEEKINHINSGPGADQPAWGLWWATWNRLQPKGPGGPYGYMVASDYTWSDLDNAIRKQNLRPWIYWQFMTVWAGDPILRDFSPEWGGTFEDPAKAHPFSALSVSNHFASLRDYKIESVYKLLHDNPKLAQGVAGLYLDVTQSEWLSNVPDETGERGNVYTLMGSRLIQQRLYDLIQAEWPQLRILNHQSGDAHLFQMSFADTYLTGEHFCMELKGNGEYYNVLSYDRLRAGYNARAMGLPVIFLPQPERAVAGDAARIRWIMGPEGIPLAEHLTGMLWLHDIIPWNKYVNPEPMNRATRAKAEFGWDNQTRFLAYWENDKVLRQEANRKTVATSIFTRPGKAMFIIMNNADQDTQVVLRPDWKALGVNTPRELVDAYAHQAGKAVNVPVADGSVAVPVKARNFRALVAQ